MRASRVGIRGNFGGDPGFALGLFNEKAKLFEGLNPDRPKCEEIFWVNDKDNVVDVSKNLYDVCLDGAELLRCCAPEQNDADGAV